jgi:hypothetical protein
MRERADIDARILAVTDHAVDRFRERTGLTWLSDVARRRIIRDGVRDGVEEMHAVPRQTRVRIDAVGASVYAILDHDETGLSETGSVVVTVLTERQAQSPRRGPEADD